MTVTSSRVLPLLLRLAAAALVAAGVASCGGSVGPSSNVSDPLRITILPATAVMYSGLPTTFSITGGTGTYIVTSDNQAVIPSPGNLLANTVTIVPNNVTAEVSGIILTVRDTGTNAPVTATVTVRPGTVNNNIDIAFTRAACSPALCSGDDALVTVTLSQGGIPLPARGVRYDVISGDYGLITTPVGTQPEVLANSTATVTDETGKARLRLRATALAPNQTALLQITDIATGAFQRTSFVISQNGGTNGNYFTLPASVTFTGSRSGVCAIGASSEFFVYGGTPPYTIANPLPNALSVSPGTVGASGRSFAVTVIGNVCPSTTTLGITDAAGNTINVTATSNPGTVTPTAVVVTPPNVNVQNCTEVASVTVTGGVGSYLQPTTSTNTLLVTQTGNLLTIRRAPLPGVTPSATSASVVVSDGLTTATVNVALGATPPVCP